MGRKGKYETHVKPYLARIRALYGVMNESDIAEQLGIGTTSFEKYKKEYPELREALRGGKKDLIADLKVTLKRKAKGFRYKETKTTIRKVGDAMTRVVEEYDKYCPPDTGAIHLLLKNIDDEWRNDDQTTIDMKKEKIEIEKLKTELNNF